MESLIRKACELGEKTAHCNVEVILNATQWMEEKYRDSPNGKIAAMITLHYLMLAIRSEYRTNPKAVEEHIARTGGKRPAVISAGIHQRCKKDQQTRISKK